MIFFSAARLRFFTIALGEVIVSGLSHENELIQCLKYAMKVMYK